MLKGILQTHGIQFDGDYIRIPEGFTHIKLDIGLSYSAPHSQIWLSKEPKLIVFGFEPNPAAVARIQSPTNTKKHSSHGPVLEHKHINTRFFLVPVALGSSTNTFVDFHVTSGDEGCSSIYPINSSAFPESYKTTKIQVPMVTLADFFALLPLDKFEYIDYIKVDAQGSDLAIIQSGEDVIRDKVVYVTLEPETNQYVGAEHNSVQNIVSYMHTIGFQRVNHPNTTDPTFVNTRFLKEAESIYICQI